jgi:hypothetical protein
VLSLNYDNITEEVILKYEALQIMSVKKMSHQKTKMMTVIDCHI